MTFEYLRQSLFFFRQHLTTLAMIQIPFLLALAVLRLTLTGRPDAESDLVHASLIGMLLEMLVLPLYWGATIFYLQSVIDDRPLKPINAILQGISSWGRLLLTYILNAIAVAIGLMLMIIPGVYVGIRFAFADYVCVLEKQGPGNSLKRSWEQTDGYFWVLLQGLVILFGSLFMLGMLVNTLFGPTSLISTLLSVGIEFGGALITIFGFRVYCAMRDEQSSHPARINDEIDED
ncbi:YciC family protein [Nitrincola sp. MINF-07-Sa-05]|uniref:YciC family protein n=1 Tax=Nitrincola salilacus TaxID=3400273 RepID=UPI003917FDD9